MSPIAQAKTSSAQPSAGTELDCLSCRIVGTAAFSGISAYALQLRSMTAKSDKGNRMFLLCFSIGAAAVAVTRFIT